MSRGVALLAISTLAWGIGCARVSDIKEPLSTDSSTVDTETAKDTSQTDPSTQDTGTQDTGTQDTVTQDTGTDTQDTDTQDTGTAPVDSLDDVRSMGTGIVIFSLTAGTLPLYVDGDYDSGGWVLIGRGREGWAWTEAGKGDPATLSVGLGTPAAFQPAYLSASIIQELIDNTGGDLYDVETRVRRAAAMDGSSYQETLWKSLANPTWTWLFDTASYNISYTVRDSVLGFGELVTMGDTRDIGSNSHARTFTWAWESHGLQTGFSYGVTVGIGNTEPTNFLWQNGTEAHSLPYSEVYLRIP
ncbi:MAG: hypothetical protein MUC50_08135 [Myxococcota bacterium]|jgi:hypothetical protein|nr:hypothetical protein [Myxococcota bacterium]